MMLKQYETGYVRKVAHIFTPEQIYLAIQLNLYSPEWILRKCAIALAFCGGLRCAELKAIKYGDIETDQEGCWVAYAPAKKRGEQTENKFLVPYNRNNPHQCFASRVLSYLEDLKKSLPNIGPTDDLFHKSLKTGYGKAVMGKNTLAMTGRVSASQLNLENPEEYTGHCFRRTSATAAANAGANTLEMKRHFNWVQENTALKYIDQTKERSRKMAKLLTGAECVTLSQSVPSPQVEAVPSPQVESVTSSQVQAVRTRPDGVVEATQLVLHTRRALQVMQEDGKKVYNMDFGNAANITLNFQ